MTSLLIRAPYFSQKASLAKCCSMLNQLNQQRYHNTLESNGKQHLNESSIPISMSALNFSTKKETPQRVHALTDKVLALRNKQINPYALFIQKNFKDTVAKNPNLPKLKMLGEAAKTWRSLSAEQKLAYSELADKNRKEKQAQLDKIFSGLSETDSDLLKKDIAKTASLRRKHLSAFRIKREKKALGRPKKPATSFVLFTKTLPRGDAPITEFIKGAGHKWKALPEQDKDKFREQAKIEQEAYSKKLKEWEGKMLSEGKDILVRKSVVGKLTKRLTKTTKRMSKLREKKLKKNSLRLRKLADGKTKALKKLQKDLKKKLSAVEKAEILAKKVYKKAAQSVRAPKKIKKRAKLANSNQSRRKDDSSDSD